MSKSEPADPSSKNQRDLKNLFGLNEFLGGYAPISAAERLWGNTSKHHIFITIPEIAAIPETTTPDGSAPQPPRDPGEADLPEVA